MAAQGLDELGANIPQIYQNRRNPETIAKKTGNITGNCPIPGKSASIIRVNDNRPRDRLAEFRHYSLSNFAVNTDTLAAVKQVLLVIALFALVQRNSFAAPLRLSYSVVGPTVASVWMAHETGMFKKYGLDVQLVYIASSGTNIQALLGGSLELSAPGMSGVVLAAARGAPV